ncbi:MAG: L-threonylcarbamoyladenylate synthase [Candidatus Woesebacteria bacterium]|jgi:L-threonylcarbamoyladenylate synthase
MIILNTKDTSQAEIIEQAVAVLKKGGLVIYPTETVYGAGVDVSNQAAVNKLLQYKSRREGKPLSVAVTDQKMAEKYVEINKQAKKLYKQFLPGPMTIISKGKDTVAAGVESEFGTLGIRIPDYDLILKIVAKLGRGITATSANASGKKRPYTVADILNNLSAKQKNLIDLIIDAGKLAPNPPSTVIDTTLSTPTILRKGKTKLVGSDEKSTQLKSESEKMTKEIAGRIMLKYWDRIKKTALILGLDGQLGAGKTIFTKGVAEFLKIKETISSPTYTYLNEYDFKRYQTKGKLYHFDMWKVDSEKELTLFEIDKLVRPNNVLVIEWWDQIAGFLANKRYAIIKINIDVLDKENRELIITEKFS